MPQITKRFLLLFSVLSLVGFGPCGTNVSGPVKFGGYVRDIVTNAVITNYTMTVESAEALTTVDIDETGKFGFSTPVGADYVITITADGYRSFTSSNRWAQASSADHQVNENLSYVFYAPLIPTTLSSAAVSGKVVDAGTGAAITSGGYRIITSGITSGFDTGLYDDGSTSTGVRWWLQDTGILSGALSDGTFSVAENMLLPGYTYDVLVFGVTGFLDQRKTLSLSTTSLNKTNYLSVALTATTKPAPGTKPVIIVQRHLGPDAVTPIPFSSARVLTIVFDRDITLTKTALKDVGSNSLITINASDNDADSTTTATPKTETVTGGSYSSNISVTTTGNKLFITMASDSALCTTLDTDDDLSYTFTSTFTNGVSVRDANATFDGNYFSLTTYGASFGTTVLIRGNYP